MLRPENVSHVYKMAKNTSKLAIKLDLKQKKLQKHGKSLTYKCLPFERRFRRSKAALEYKTGS